MDFFFNVFFFIGDDKYIREGLIQEVFFIFNLYLNYIQCLKPHIASILNEKYNCIFVGHSFPFRCLKFCLKYIQQWILLTQR